jgi:hypothetical protein
MYVTLMKEIVKISDTAYVLQVFPAEGLMNISPENFPGDLRWNSFNALLLGCTLSPF